MNANAREQTMVYVPRRENRDKIGDKSRYIETIIVRFITILSPIFVDYFNDLSDKS